MDNKTRKKLKKLYKQYQNKHDEIMKRYGEKDGFIIQGIPWWDCYKKLIDEVLKKIKDNTFKENDALNFYRNFGFGPKLYPDSFLKNGLERIKEAILHLADPRFSAKEKLSSIVEDKKNELYLQGIGRNFVTLFLASYFLAQYGQWNKPIDEALTSLKLYPKKERGESLAEQYTKINRVLLEIKETLSLESLPIVDNLLFCLNRGYIEIPPEPEPAPESPEEIVADQISHWDAAAILAKLGEVLNFDIYVADPKRKTKLFNIDLGSIAKPTKELPEEFIGVRDIKKIDVIWLPPRGSYEKSYFFEIEDKGTMREAMHRLYQVLMFDARLFILGPEHNRERFKRWRDTSPYNSARFKDRCQYRNYEELIELFEKARDYFDTKEHFFE